MKQAPQKLTISKDEILACYAQGEEAVIVLVESLVARINALETRIEVLEKMNQGALMLNETERVRFELTETCASSDFKSDAIDHSATFPNIGSLSYHDRELKQD